MAQHEATIDVAGDILRAIWDGNVWVAPSCGSQHSREWDALAVELALYLGACGEPTEHIDGAYVRDHYDIVR